jgi:hypothetical protein
LGQKQTCALQKGMSALPPKADMCCAKRNVCFGPKADIRPITVAQNVQRRAAMHGQPPPEIQHKRLGAVSTLR